MIKKVLVFTAAVVVLVVGAYLEALWHVTPVLNAGFLTARTMLGDLYVYLMTSSLEINSTALVFALTGLLILLSARFFLGARKM